jgi:hypothetical protein
MTSHEIKITTLQKRRGLRSDRRLMKLIQEGEVYGPFFFQKEYNEK